MLIICLSVITGLATVQHKIRIDKMRDLTQQEIDNAPEWATHYIILEFSSLVRYTDGIKFVCGKSKHEISVPSELDDPLDNAKPIPRKPFDISGYEFSGDISTIKARVSDNHLVLEFVTKQPWVSISESDVEAMAKHFKQLGRV